MTSWTNYDDGRRWISPQPAHDYHYPQVYPPPSHDHLNSYYPYVPVCAGAENSAPHSSHPYITTTIGIKDVLFGRGGATNSNSGNKAFRRLVKLHKDEYLNAKKKDKPAVAARVVETVRSQGGHFLRQYGTSQDGRHIYWVDVGDDRAKEKTCQALREGAPAILRQKRSAQGVAEKYSVDEDEESSSTGREPEEQDKVQESTRLCERQAVSATDSSSWGSSSIDDNALRHWKRLPLPMGWEGEPIALHQLPPAERDMYLREFLPPMPKVHKKPRLHQY